MFDFGFSKNNIIINGVSYSGKNVNIKNNNIYIDNKEISINKNNEDKLIINITGSINELQIDTCNSITVESIGNITLDQGNINVKTVSGNITLDQGNIKGEIFNGSVKVDSKKLMLNIKENNNTINKYLLNPNEFAIIKLTEDDLNYLSNFEDSELISAYNFLFLTKLTEIEYLKYISQLEFLLFFNGEINLRFFQLITKEEKDIFINTLKIENNI